MRLLRGAGSPACQARARLEEAKPAVLKSENVVAALRRDASFLGRAVVAILFVGFATIVVAATLYDLLSIRNRLYCGRIGVSASIEILDNEMFAAVADDTFDIAWTDRRFAMAARNIEHVSRLA